MYADFFGLKSRPFVNGPASGFFKADSEIDNAMTRIQQVLLARDAVAIVTGGPGVGKSAIVANAVNAIDDQVIVANIDLRQTEPELLYDMLLLGLGDEASDGNVANSLNRLRLSIARHNEAGRRVSAVIDITGLTVERAKRILRLAHMAGEPGGQLNIILLGPHILHKLMDTPGLIHLRQRVCFRHRVRPFTVGDTDAYLKHQIESAGGDVNKVLAHGTGIIAYRYVGGVPRLINTLMDSVLTVASIRQLDQVTSELVTEVAENLGWKPLAQRAAAKAAQSITKPIASQSPAVVEKQPEPELTTSEPARETAPVSQDTARLLAATDLLDTTPDKPATSDDVASVSEAAHEVPPPVSTMSGVPEMNADDTSATGMLKLEDLDARMAETVFGEDTGMFKAFDVHKAKEAEQAG
jgi:general secretion pathway protein A